MAATEEKVLLDVWPEAGERIGLGRTTTWKLVRSGALRTVRQGRRRLVPVDALREYAQNLPPAP
ncbi:helix-turn-helix domain-containing protein [Actinoallomurus sp. CA-142502]|uniref:helix-turn-helix domain-containing protein n=1 Tax=Actinoallomurus sp. CA-142502 TaxID=3239885 RepID=UPI003D8CA1C6